MIEGANRERLIAWLAACNKDPLAFVMGAFPWGVKDSYLEDAELEEWQIKILKDVGEGILDLNQAVQLAVASGHGVGKSALISMLILWAFSTAPDTRGVVTANTETQLKTKTWAELGRWYNMFIAKEFFTLTATALFSKDPARQLTWRIDMIPWSEKNPAAFAGLHNKGKRLILFMDEASEIPDIIHEVAEGAMTDADTEIIWLMFGNPTRNLGRFKEAFPGGRFAAYWKTLNLDSRTVKITNKKRLNAWVETYGEDSDFVRIRVKGQFPRTGMMEFFSAAEIDAAMKREVTVDIHQPLALGVDVARFGANNSVIYPRKGRDARSLPRKVYNGVNTVELATRVFETHTELRPDGIFIDGGGVGGGVVDNCRNQHLFVYEVQFGGKDDVGGSVWGIPGEKYANKRAAMYGALRSWLRTGAIPDDPQLKAAMLAIKYSFNNKDEILLESKEDIMEDHPEVILDDLDGLVLTFAYPLAAHANAGGDHLKKDLVESEYNPYDPERMVA